MIIGDICENVTTKRRYQIVGIKDERTVMVQEDDQTFWSFLEGDKITITEMPKSELKVLRSRADHFYILRDKGMTTICYDTREVQDELMNNPKQDIYEVFKVQPTITLKAQSNSGNFLSR